MTVNFGQYGATPASLIGGQLDAASRQHARLGSSQKAHRSSDLGAASSAGPMSIHNHNGYNMVSEDLNRKVRHLSKTGRKAAEAAAASSSKVMSKREASLLQYNAFVQQSSHLYSNGSGVVHHHARVSGGADGSGKFQVQIQAGPQKVVGTYVKSL